MRAFPTSFRVNVTVLGLLVGSGFEGGGHRGSSLRCPEHSLIGGVSLIPQVVDAITVPVIAPVASPREEDFSLPSF
jgi:hypothetical protein